MVQYTERILNALLKFLGVFSRRKAERIAHFFGKILFNIDKKHRKIALDNLTYAFGQEKQLEETERIAQQVFINLVKIVFEIAWSLHLKENQFKEHFKIDGYH
ncbi:MAG TPA: lauroyl acyltransferase, partial [Desulfobacterales bacterium]|nr:lauroyl acyltransferase [Desulfobacterales bacterium]